MAFLVTLCLLLFAILVFVLWSFWPVIGKDWDALETRVEVKIKAEEQKIKAKV